MAKRSRPAPRLPLDRDRVLAAAVRLADEGGLELLTMRRLAEVLGVQAMSLYNHVANREDVLDGMVEAVVGEFEVPAIGGDWRRAMHGRARSAHEALLRHPWAALLIASRLNVGPAMLRYVDATLGCLVEAGFTWIEADRAYNAIDSHVYGFTLQELSFPIPQSDYQDAARQYLPMLPADRYPHARALAERVAAGTHDGRNDFEFGLRLILDGLERLLATRRPARRR